MEFLTGRKKRLSPQTKTPAIERYPGSGAKLAEGERLSEAKESGTTGGPRKKI